MREKSGCEGCERIHMLPEAAGTLYLSAAVPHTRKKILQAADTLDLSGEEAMAGIVGIRLATGELGDLLETLGDRLSDPEREECNAIFLGESESLDMAGLMRARSLDVLMARQEGRWLVDLMQADRLLMHFHPIVSLREPGRVHAHECLLRGHGADGELISPARLFQSARRADLLFHLDRAARLAAIRDSVHHGIKSKIFINFNPTAIYDPTFCLQTTVRATQDLGIDPSRLVFEVIESDEIKDKKHLLNILDFYRKAGFGVALDDLGSGYASLNLLSSLRPDYVKFDRELISEIDHNPYKQKIFDKLSEMAADLGIQTVAEGVETVAELEFLNSRKVDFAQGFLFCRPASPAPEAVWPTF